MNCPSCLQPVCRCHPVAWSIREWLALESNLKKPELLMYQAAQTIDELTARVEILSQERKYLNSSEQEILSAIVDRETAITTAQERIKELQTLLDSKFHDIDLEDKCENLQSALTKCQEYCQKYQELSKKREEKHMKEWQEEVTSLEALADRLVEAGMLDLRDFPDEEWAKGHNLHLQNIREGK